MKYFIALFLLVCVSCTKPHVQNADKAHFTAIDSTIKNQEQRIITLEKHAQKQDSVIQVLALHAYHADSVAGQKQFKNDRAERRGRFLGGLLRSLVPGLK